MAESQDAELGVPSFKLWFLPDWAWRMTSSYLINPSELYFPRLLGERHGGSEVISRIRESSEEILSASFSHSSVNAANRTITIITLAVETVN